MAERKNVFTEWKRNQTIILPEGMTYEHLRPYSYRAKYDVDGQMVEREWTFATHDELINFLNEHNIKPY